MSQPVNVLWGSEPDAPLRHRPGLQRLHSWIGKALRPFQAAAADQAPAADAALDSFESSAAVILDPRWANTRLPQLSLLWPRAPQRGRADDPTRLRDRPAPARGRVRSDETSRQAAPAPERSAVVLNREVRFGSIRYPFYVRSGSAAWHELADLLTDLHADRFLLVTDSGVPTAAVHAVRLRLTELAPTTLLRVPSSEQAKTIRTVDDLARQAFTSGATRRSVVVALGGGLAGNVGGLLAHLFLRGTRLVHVPTTLLAMSDSVLSLKQAVNSPVGKNHLGAFHAPELVWVQLEFLDTLPPSQIRAALCEAIKNVIAICPGRYDEMAARLRADAVYTPAEFAWFIGSCVAAKQEVMAADPCEKGRALILEYGHTVGHAAEFASGGSFSHGLAIGVGGLVAARIASLLGVGDPVIEMAHESLLQLNGSPTFLRAGLTTDHLMQVIRLDNKRGYRPQRNGHIDMILLADLGQPYQTGGSIITQVPEGLVHAGIESRINRLTTAEGQE
ncbi:MAG TPA: 2-deoxy-scyllo-inosose synthase [Streptosporangiaceae bacterium]|nr:2-deoxy-scyllo-inosose synthase [Streptosporangiaceae bacterium]